MYATTNVCITKIVSLMIYFGVFFATKYIQLTNQQQHLHITVFPFRTHVIHECPNGLMLLVISSFVQHEKFNSINLRKDQRVITTFIDILLTKYTN